MDETVQYDGRAFNFGTSFNSRDDHCNNVGLYGKSRGGEDGKECNMVAQEVHQYGDVIPISNSSNKTTWKKAL